MTRAALGTTMLLALCLRGNAFAQTPQQAQAAIDRQLREQREELDRIRLEREGLEKDALVLRNTAHELSDEVSNLDRRVAASAKLVTALDKQLTLIGTEVEVASNDKAKAESELVIKRATLEKRVVDVYKRGPLFTVEALLSARSFGELVARYKYLHDLTLRDRALVDRVEELRNRVSDERDRLITLQGQLETSRADKAREEDRLRDLEEEQANNLRVVQQQAKRTQDKIERLKKTEQDMLTLLASLEAARKKAEAARPAAKRAIPSSSAIKTSDYGKLDWPVAGDLVYTFGKGHWKGIGIAAAAGTPVKSVGDGKVVMARPLDTYGLTVIVDHGAGDYTIYGSLKSAAVKEGQSVTKGETLGTTGISDPDLPAHLHFEIRTGGRDAVDPVKWLRNRR